jgi:hypothetical protein
MSEWAWTDKEEPDFSDRGERTGPAGRGDPPDAMAEEGGADPLIHPDLPKSAVHQKMRVAGPIVCQSQGERPLSWRH